MAISAALILLPVANADSAPIAFHSDLPERGWIKVSHGYVIAFNRTQKLTGRNSVEIFDREGKSVLTLDLLRQLPEAAEVTLGDIAIRPGSPLVVSATIRKKDSALQDVLLYFTAEGLIKQSVNLPPEQAINKLDLDEKGNVWTLTDYLGRDDDTKGPLIFVYGPAGKLVNGLLRRTDYPAGFREGTREGGLAAFGVNTNSVWFWQPARRRMTVVDHEGRILQQMPIALPRSHKSRDHPPEAGFLALLPSRQVVAGIVSPWPDVPTGAYISRGKRFVGMSKPNLLLISVDGPEFVFLKQFTDGSSQFELLREPLAPGH